MTTYTGPLQWVAVDFDGTLCGLAWTPEEPTKMGEPLWHNVRQMEYLKSQGWKIAIHTARTADQLVDIARWLAKHNIEVHKIVTDKFLAHRYIDDRAIRAQSTNWKDQMSD